MPVYEYKCNSCDGSFEFVQKFSDAPEKICGKCGGDLRKVYSAAGIIFRGSGWHIKDYK